MWKIFEGIQRELTNRYNYLLIKLEVNLHREVNHTLDKVELNVSKISNRGYKCW